MRMPYMQAMQVYIQMKCERIHITTLILHLATICYGPLATLIPVLCGQKGSHFGLCAQGGCWRYHCHSLVHFPSSLHSSSEIADTNPQISFIQKAIN